MVFPSDLLVQFGPKLAAGDIAGVVARFSMPFAVAMDGTQQVIESTDIAAMCFTKLRSEMLDRGMVDATSSVTSQAYMGDDMMMARVETNYFDGNHNRIDQTCSSYVLRKVEGKWQIVMLSVDEPIRNTTKLCLPETAAA